VCVVAAAYPFSRNTRRATSIIVLRLPFAACRREVESYVRRVTDRAILQFDLLTPN
jgi:hypothetical protein